MHRLLRSIFYAVLSWMIVAPGLAAADCRKGAVELLRAKAPDGFAIYQQMPDKDFFVHWIDCSDAQLGLSTAVHESVHYITADSDAFPLVDGGTVKRPHDVSAFYPPSLIAGRFKTGDFVSTYLRHGKASSGSDFLYLLDELNAYSHDLNAAVDLKALHHADEQVDNRDGLAALMAFVAVYAQTAEASQPATWSGLRSPEVAKTVAALWERAEAVMASSCGIPNFGSEDKAYIRQVCMPQVQASVEKLIGRAPVCPSACLTAPEATDETEGATVEMTSIDMPRRSPANNQSALRRFWSRTSSHRVSRAGNVVTEQETTGQ